jgi:hypothetical protein
MTRPDLRMDGKQLDSFLSRCRTMSVAVLDPGGEIDVAVAACHYQDGDVTLTFDPDDPILPLLDGGHSLCAQADEAPSYYEIQGVILHGFPTPLGLNSYSVGTDDAVTFDFGKIPARMQ